MRLFLALTTVCLLSAAVAAKPARPPLDNGAKQSALAEPGTVVPAGIPLHVRFIANETVYRLDRGGLSELDYRKSLELGEKTGNLAAAPRVDLVFELQNNGKEDMQIMIGGDVSGTLRWQLRGPGAVSVVHHPGTLTTDFKGATAVKIAAGEIHRWVFKDLDCSGPRDRNRVYWTQPGDYLLSAGFTVAVRPAPRGSVPHAYYKDHANVAITSGAVRITVLDGK